LEVLASLEKTLPQLQWWRPIHQQEGETNQQERAAARGKRWLHYSSGRPDKPTAASIRERNTAVTSFYNQTTIDQAAAKPSVRLTPATIMYSSMQMDSRQTALRSAQYLHHELPVRLAHRIAGFRSLPFIIGCNPSILAVHELYIRAFHILNDFPELLNLDDVSKYSSILKTLMEDHKDVMATLAQGFRDSRKHISEEKTVSAFLDRTLCSRLGIRMLVTHHLLIQEPKPGHVGIVNLCMSLRDVVQRWAAFVTDLCEEKYGHCPTFRISGHTHASFPYIEMPLDYILPELLKNAARATIESNPNLRGTSLPPVSIVLASNSQDFIVRVSDRGGGIPHDQVDSSCIFFLSGHTAVSPGGEGAAVQLHHRREEHGQDGGGLRDLRLHDGGGEQDELGADARVRGGTSLQCRLQRVPRRRADNPEHAGFGDRRLHTAEAPGVPNRLPNSNLVNSFSSFHRLVISMSLFMVAEMSRENI